jgi:eukaryotic-like serine/threonine-protein kinase
VIGRRITFDGEIERAHEPAGLRRDKESQAAREDDRPGAHSKTVARPHATIETGMASLGLPQGGTRRVGRYLLYGELASGGMATVHLGRLVGPVGFSRTIAIKCLHPHLAKEPEFVTMFIDEARLAARIVHPNVVPVLDVVEIDDELFLVMEYVHGETLARLLRSVRSHDERIPPKIAAAIVAGALHGLHAAHEALSERGEPLEIVHRDVSPQNVIVGADGVARVLDFGVAKATERLMQTTREGQVKGKLAYMAPEQVHAGRVNRQTDIYAASIVLWEALTGERLFGGSNEGEVIDRVLLAEVDAPSQRAPGLTSDYDAIVLRGLARERSERFSTAREMAMALENVGVAKATEVGEWVQGQADEVLAARSRWMASLESVEHIPRDGDAPERAAAAVDRVPAAAHSPPVAVSSSRGWVVVRRPYLLVTLAGLGAIAVALVLRASSRGTFADVPSAAPSAAAAPASHVVSAEKSEAPSSSPSAPATAADSVSPAASTEPTTPQAPMPRPRSSPRADCSPPYTLSPSGKKTYKRNCL